MRPREETGLSLKGRVLIEETAVCAEDCRSPCLARAGGVRQGRRRWCRGRSRLFAAGGAGGPVLALGRRLDVQQMAPAFWMQGAVIGRQWGRGAKGAGGTR